MDYTAGRKTSGPLVVKVPLKLRGNYEGCEDSSFCGLHSSSCCPDWASSCPDRAERLDRQPRPARPGKREINKR